MRPPQTRLGYVDSVYRVPETVKATPAVLTLTPASALALSLALVIKVPQDGNGLKATLQAGSDAGIPEMGMAEARRLVF